MMKRAEHTMQLCVEFLCQIKVNTGSPKVTHVSQSCSDTKYIGKLERDWPNLPTNRVELIQLVKVTALR